ncbi:MAG TPA: hypothetical protein VJN94_00530 [Candidatus Binataceae bacterium]|nr:hypothetical protein [Candidatus Binataceae bacterium]
MKLALQSTAVLVVLFGIAHTLGYPWVGHMSPENVAKLSDVFNSTRTVTQGFARTYDDTHVGFGLYISFFFAVQAILTWHLAKVAASNPALTRFIAAVFAIQYAGTVLLDFFFFFWGPIIFSAFIAAGYLISFALIRPRPPRPVAAQV